MLLHLPPPFDCPPSNNYLQKLNTSSHFKPDDPPRNQRNRFNQGDKQSTVLRQGDRTAMEASGGQAQSAESCRVERKKGRERRKGGIYSLIRTCFARLNGYAKAALVATVGPAVHRLVHVDSALFFHRVETRGGSKSTTAKPCLNLGSLTNGSLIGV